MSHQAWTGAYAPEVDALCASPIACAVADEWQDWKNRNGDSPRFTGNGEGALNALEAATRESSLRKVKP